MNNTIVSVIVPAYNLAEYLPETLDSLLNQTYQDWECIIVNDGSSDNTEAVALTYLEKDTRFKYFLKENGGLSDTRNYGIERAVGTYIFPLDADDVIAPRYLADAVDVLEKNNSIKVVYCKASYFGEKDGSWDLPEYSFAKLLKANLIFCTAMYRKSDYVQTEGYAIEMKGGYEDWDFWLSLLKNGGDVYQIPETYFYYRIRNNSMARIIDEKLNEDLCNRIYRRHFETYLKYWGSPFEMIAYKEQFLSLTNGREYKLMKKIYAPIKKIRQLLNI